MKLGELAKLYDFDLAQVEVIILEQEHHVNRVRFIPPPTAPLTYHSDQSFNEIIYPYVWIELKSGDIIDTKIARYSWQTTCPIATGGVPR